jgi:hypothetical protein
MKRLDPEEKNLIWINSVQLCPARLIAKHFGISIKQVYAVVKEERNRREKWSKNRL